MAATEADVPGRGDAIDWAAALREHDRWLRTVVFARTGERQAVDEVMQEVAVAAVGSNSPPAKIAPWLYRLAVRQSLLFRRRLGRLRRLRERYESRVATSDFVAGERDPLEWLLADERRRLIRSALERLSRRDAEILLLKYTENWSYSQLAEHLGMTHAAVESRLHRARQRLRRELAALEVVGVAP